MNLEFPSHLLNDMGVARAIKIGASFDALLEALDPSDARITGLCPKGPEMSIVRTFLEEACFFAVKSISMQPENQRVRDKSKP